MTRRSARTPRVPAQVPPPRQPLDPRRRLRLATIAAHDHWRAALIFGLLVLIYLWPALIEGRLLSPVSLLYLFAPWRPHTPPDFASYTNPLLFDVPSSFYPWAVLARDLIHAGTFPAWNPFALAGTPLFANPQAALLSPFSLPLWVLPLNYAFGFAAALKLFVGGLGAYLLVRELKLGFWPGVLAGVSFAFCAFNVVWLTHGVQVSVAVLLPWILWLTERIVSRGRASAGAWLAVASAVAFAGGHPGTQLHVMFAAGLYALLRVTVGVPGVAGRERLRRLGIVGAGIVVGALLLAVALVPGVRNASDTIGALVREDGARAFPGATLPLGAVRTALFPDWWGRPDDLVFNGPANYNERTFYAGAVALLLASAALATRSAWRRKLPFAVLGALGLAVPLNAPGLHWLVIHAPFFDSVQNQRMLLLFALAVPVLAAFGLQALIDAPRGQRSAWLAVGAAVVIAVIATISIGPSGDELAGTLGDAVGGIDPVTAVGQVSAERHALASVTKWLVLAIAVAAVLLALRRWPHRRLAIAAAVAVLAAVDMLHFADGYQPMGPASRAIPPRTDEVAYVQEHAGRSRVVGVNLALTTDWSTVYGLRDPRGHDPPQPSLRYFRLWRLANPTQDWRPLNIERLTPAGLNALSVLGTRYIMVPPGTVVPDVASVSAVYRGAGATIFANSHAVAPAFVAPSVRVVEGERQTLDLIASADFDPRREAIVERDEARRHGLIASAPPNGGSASIVREENTEVVVRARLERRGLVVLADNLTDGWSVRVDGRPASVVRVDSVLRGVVVPAGSHVITWTYRVPGLRTGLLLSGIGLLILSAWVVLLGRRRRRPPTLGGRSERDDLTL